MSFQTLTVIALFLCSALAQADGPAFNQLTDGQAKDIIKEFSANFTHTTVSGARPLGDVFGFEFGLIGGLSKSNEIGKLTKQADPSSDFDQMMHGGIVALVSVPLGFTFEGSLIPKVGSDDFKFQNLGLAVKWTLNSIVELPVSLAIKAHMMHTDLDFKQTVNGNFSSVTFKNQVSGALALVSADLTVVEPYFGLGLLSGDGTFNVSGSNQFFQSGVSKYNSKESGTQIVAGLEAKLLVLKLGAEYVNNFGASGFNAKLAFAF